MFQRIERNGDQFGRVSGDIPGGGRFTVWDQGAQITDWRPGDVPVLWLSEYARFEPQVAIRGGMPISFPWFADGRKANKSPAHGFARLSNWQLMRAEETNRVTLLEWRLIPAMLPEIPGVDPDRNRFDLRCIQHFDSELTVSFRIRNTDDHPLVVEEALHTYFHVGDVRQVSIHGLGGAEYLDKLTGAYDTQVGPVTVNGQIDRIFWSRELVEIHDPVLNRRIIIDGLGSANTVIWNPGPEKTRQMTDFGDDEWTRMVCVESANIRDKVRHLNPGQTHELTLKIRLAEL